MLPRPRADAARLVPEVIQSSNMDCGPASLMALMRGFGLPVSFGRLREACQTTVDGTSISAMDEVANQLGLDTQEVMLPPDHLLLPEADALPAIAVISNEVGTAHFVVVWSKIGRWVQLMDPARGRRWLSQRELEETLYRHTVEVPAKAWRRWAATDEFQGPLARRLLGLGLNKERADELRAQTLADEGYLDVAALDAACRMTMALIRARAVKAGQEASNLLEQLYAWGRDIETCSHLPVSYWSVRPASNQDPRNPQQLAYRAAVLVRTRGRHATRPDIETLDEDLAAALTDEQPHPFRSLLGMLARDGLTTPLVMAAAVFLAAALVLLEAVLLRGFLELSGQIGLASDRAIAVSLLLLLLMLGLVLRFPIIHSAASMGRLLEVRLRVAFLSKIPKLNDRYFHSRLISDMAERCHSLHLLRYLPILGVTFLDACAQLIFITVGIAWIEPSLAPWALAVALLSITLPLALQPVLTERSLTLRTHLGGMINFYLDSLLGLIPIRVHGAQLAVAREQEARLVEWSRAAMALHRTSTWVEGVLAFSGFGCAVLMVSLVATAGESGLENALLVVYWALSMPMLGARAAQVARQYPDLHNVALRVLEPLGAHEEEVAKPEPGPVASEDPAPAPGVAIAMAGVTVEAGGHRILEQVDLTIAPGEHVAIVGESGAGKSSLVGLLLGWHRARSGTVEVDGRILTGAWLGTLRRSTAWLDPTVQLWNQPLLDNLIYGSEFAPDNPMSSVLHQAELRELLEHLPDGMQTRLGESGRLLSGGEGQRVRLGRALMQRDARLVLLDEAFRGLDRETRQRLTRRVRQWWQNATLLSVSHDITDTRDFERVLVIHEGRLVEDGSPQHLLADETSRYSVLMAKDRAMRERAWARGTWRTMWLENGRLHEEPPDDRDERHAGG
jgi:ABC-type bacteriocin/lantibiotic exporter with double-glycine peptidase domain